MQVINIMKKKPIYKEQEWIDTSEKLKALAHPVRLYIISLLKHQKEMNVGELQDELIMEQAVVSHHLNILKNKNILSCRRDGKNKYYYLTDKKYLNILHCMEN